MNRRISRPMFHVALCVVPALLLLYAVALLTPVGSAPDEQAHIYHAAAVVRGDLSGEQERVPAGIAWVRNDTCMAFHPEITGACQVPFHGGSKTRAVSTAAGNYNPLYYAWVGLATLVRPDPSGVYGARLLGATVVAVLLGWTLSILLRRGKSRWAVTGLALAWTPMVTYLGSVVNPSGWEISAAIASTVAAWLVVHKQPDDATWEPYALLLFGGILFLTSRNLSPEYAGLVLLAVLACAGRDRTVVAWRVARTRGSIAALAIVGVISLLWTVLHPTTYIGVQPPSSLAEGVRDIPAYYQVFYGQVQQMFGVTGWLDQMPPNLLVAVWVTLGTAFLAIAYLAGDLRTRLTLVAGLLAVLVLPAVLQGLFFGTGGWQGRYILPILCSLFVLAGLALSERDATFASPEMRSARRQIGIASAVGFGVFHLGVLANTVHRVSVGANRPWLADASWHGPLGIVAPSIAVVASLLWLGWLFGSPAEARTPEASAPLVL